MKKVKEFVKKHKTELIVGTEFVGAVVYAVYQWKNGKNLAGQPLPKLNDFNWGFNDLDEALAKFKELSQDAKPGTIALWNEGMEGFEYLVQDLG